MLCEENAVTVCLDWVLLIITNERDLVGKKNKRFERWPNETNRGKTMQKTGAMCESTAYQFSSRNTPKETHESRSITYH